MQEEGAAVQPEHVPCLPITCSCGDSQEWATLSMSVAAEQTQLMNL